MLHDVCTGYTTAMGIFAVEERWPAVVANARMGRLRPFTLSEQSGTEKVADRLSWAGCHGAQGRIVKAPLTGDPQAVARDAIRFDSVALLPEMPLQLRCSLLLIRKRKKESLDVPGVWMDDWTATLPAGRPYDTVGARYTYAARVNDALGHECMSPRAPPACPIVCMHWQGLQTVWERACVHKFILLLGKVRVSKTACHAVEVEGLAIVSYATQRRQRTSGAVPRG